MSDDERGDVVTSGWVDNIAVVVHDDQNIIDGLAAAGEEDEWSDNAAEACFFDAISPRPQGADPAWLMAWWGTARRPWVEACHPVGPGAIRLEFRTEGHPPLPLYGTMQQMGFLVFARYHDLNGARFGSWDNGAHTETVSRELLLHWRRAM
jgi:hypothetical protein